VQVARLDGSVVASTTNVSGLPLLFEAPNEQADWFEASGLPIDDEEFRVLARTVEREDGPLTLYVAASLEPVSESAESLIAVLRFGVPLMLMAVAAGTWLIVGRSLRPIERIRNEVEAISLATLEKRVPEPGTRDEVGRLARTMNELLARLEAAHRREEQFIADAAHELRSPIASLRTQVEVRRGRGAGEADPGGHDLLAEVARLQSLADNLLVLASHGHPPTATILDLDDLVLEEAKAVALPAGKRVVTGTTSAAAVVGEPNSLRSVIRNLLDNGLRYAASTVSVGLSEQAGTVRLTVSDDGPGIAPEDRERIFERFVRLDGARSTGGAGLGLAICRAVAEAHGGTIRVDDADGPGARFIVELPAAL
jgi:signal transduction histidine kinase